MRGLPERKRAAIPDGMGFSIASAAASAALAVQSAIPSQVPALDPSGPWTVETSGTMCLVGRKFSAAGSEITLGFRKIAGTDNFQVLIWRPIRSTEVSKGKARLVVDHSAAIEARYLRGPVTITNFELTEIATKRTQVEALDKAKTLQVLAGDFTGNFNLRGVGGAMKALEDCERKLLAS